jgi:hypothetical protein
MRTNGPSKTRMSPIAVIAGGKVGVGCLRPSLPPVQISPPDVEDQGKVRLGFLSPSLAMMPLRCGPMPHLGGKASQSKSNPASQSK